MRWTLLVVFAVACSTGAKRDDGPPMPTAEPTKPDNGPKVFIETAHGEVPVNVEIVATEAKIERGLMYRQHLPPDDGMLFLASITMIQRWTAVGNVGLTLMGIILIRTKTVTVCRLVP